MTVDNNSEFALLLRPAFNDGNPGSGDAVTRRREEQKQDRRVSASQRRPAVESRSSSRPTESYSSRVPLITLLTDFGTADYFVSAMKGVILSLNPSSRIVDITHHIPAHDIEAAAFTLLAIYSSFPARTIHVAVVDPQVGSARNGMLVEAEGQYFVGPDNGIFSYVCERAGVAKFFHLRSSAYFRPPVSKTFHGRDIFAPIAAALASGITPKKLGREIKDPVRLAPLLPEKAKNGKLTARIIHIDRFGNCITNITPQNLTAKMIEDGAYLTANDRKIDSFRSFFSEQDAKGKELFGIWGSAGFLELAATSRSAAKILGAKKGESVIVTYAKG